MDDEEEEDGDAATQIVAPVVTDQQPSAIADKKDDLKTAIWSCHIPLVFVWF